ncbi:ABC transporter ATP-binding protein [Halobacillus andaensis]|uniref:ABC transporter ATP-binding protein n=1 Tax=Halobacillus andaensis TaxID=1176239 RepID=A0A917B1L5_HALAA|nr:ABC transporter ATP-binding protein [Halobacillus andaensis]MBP2003982.1 ABC-2 type transport system ATP-binding protein [Halobacillus andaensis]GGF14880.1 ABC transporter ATP-binding protein [Halobacillus andaensis]
MTEPVAQIKNVKKQIGNKTIIHGISLNVYPGEVFGFLGPNGAGKTTMIRMIVGLMKVTEGDIYIQGNHVNREYQKAIAEVGAIIENPEMYDFLSGYENLKHYARLAVKPISEDRIKEIVRLVGLSGRINEKVKGYSLGMKQRLGIAQALLHSPSLLILDEPTNGLDPAGIREIREYIRKIAHEENLAVFVSSHLLAEMQLMCDRIGIIQHGRLLQVEKMDMLLNKHNKRIVQINAHPLGKVIEYLQALSWSVHQSNEIAHVEIEKQEDIAKLASDIVKGGYQLYQLNEKHESLENTFLELTKEEL